MTAPARILLVEDDRFLRKAAEVRLKRAGLAVITAGDGVEALEKAKENTLDLILLDLIMPKLQGFDVLRALKEDPRTRDVPVLIMSNLGQDADRERAALAGAAGYLVKANMSLDALAGEVLRLLERKGVA
jgi:twitching motility two-component system response regulator PilH